MPLLGAWPPVEHEMNRHSLPEEQRRLQRRFRGIVVSTEWDVSIGTSHRSAYSRHSITLGSAIANIAMKVMPG
jgi:hypothetical protein